MSSSIGATSAAQPANDAQSKGAPEKFYVRFGRIERLSHSLLMISFVGCALTGTPLLFANQAWARLFIRVLGGFQGAGLIHRICAVIMIVVFLSHVLRVFYRAMTSKDPMSLFWGPNTMVPQLQDGIDLVNQFKWFFGQGPQPHFDRYTYWEKFDYWAVFWGMFIIGGSGLMLWFPTVFSRVVPGWVFNFATILHGEEALLAVGFIFTIHFFNGHLRPEKFPMDMVIFTGRVSEHEMKDERAKEFARLAKSGKLAELESSPPSRKWILWGQIAGGTAVVLGVLTATMIFWSILR